MSNCTNAWIKELGLEDIKTSPAARGTNPNLFYNCFYRICGVEDKVIYINELYQFQQELKHAGRSVVILNQGIQMPGPEEIASIRRGNYQKVEQLIMDLSGNINYAGHQEIQRLMRKAFVDLILEEAEHLGDNLNKLTSRAVILLCWLKRFGGQLFGNWTSNKISCLIHLGACTNEQEALFLRLLARLPVDVLILCPDLSQNCCVTDELLFEKRYEQSMRVTEYPQEGGQVSVGTAAYHAERELDTLMYQDSGMYRNQQYTRANTINLQTMYEEIKILWDQELKFRPNFATVDGMVNLPVIFAKVCGVKNGQLPDYWLSVRQLVTEDTLYIPRAPYIKPTDRNPIKMFAPEFYKNGRLQKKKIRQHPNYPYGFLREEMQEYMLDKLALLIEQK